MPKYRVYAIATASWVLGEYEAETPEEAEKMVDDDQTAEMYKSLCHQCSAEVEVGDAYKFEVELAD